MYFTFYTEFPKNDLNNPWFCVTQTPPCEKKLRFHQIKIFFISSSKKKTFFFGVKTWKLL